MKNSPEYIFDNINLTFNSKSKIGLIGKNGCGKTTLFKLFLGIENTNDRQCESVKKLKIGYLPQELPIDDAISLEEYFCELRSISAIS